MDEKLARVRWEMGQPLLPEHLVAQEEALLADTVQRFNMQGLPSYGIGRLKLNETLLQEGVFSIKEMTLVMGSGLLLDVPNNAQLSPFNLNVPGTTTVHIYLHLLNDLPEKKTTSGWEDESETSIARVIYQLVLSSEQSYADAVQSLKIAEVTKSPDEVWQISPNFVPPLLQVGKSPFLLIDLEELAETLELFQYDLSMDAASYLSGESLFTVKQCLKSVMNARRLLGNLGSRIFLHPYFLYEALNNLYTDVCFYRNTAPENVIAPYEHNDLTNLTKLMELVKKQMQLVQSRPPYLPFELQENVYKLKLPEEIRKATDVYFLAQKNQITARFFMDNVKLSSNSRLSFIHKMALHGIPSQKVERPPFQHSFGSEVEFYQLMFGEEWDHVLKEMTVTFQTSHELKGMDFYLYWRRG